MRIVYFAHSVLNRGGDKMVLAHLGQLAAAGHRVVIRANRVATDFALHPAITLEKPALPGKGGTLLSALLEKQKADVVIATIAATAVLLGLRNPGRVLHFAQDDNESGYTFPLMRALMRFLYIQAFCVLRLPTVAVSGELARHFRESFAGECRVVENGVDASLFHPAPSPELLAAKGERKALLCLSRSDRRKGYDLAQQAVALLEKQGHRFELWSVGERLPHRGEAPHREFGAVDQATLRGIFSSADVFLYPSRSEGFGLMVLEAMACGCPVVTTGAVGFAEDGVNALVAPVEDAASLARQVARLFEDRELAGRLADNGLRLALSRRLQDSSSLFQEELALFFGSGSPKRPLPGGKGGYGHADVEK